MEGNREGKGEEWDGRGRGRALGRGGRGGKEEGRGGQRALGVARGGMEGSREGKGGWRERSETQLHMTLGRMAFTATV